MKGKSHSIFFPDYSPRAWTTPSEPQKYDFTSAELGGLCRRPPHSTTQNQPLFSQTHVKYTTKQAKKVLSSTQRCRSAGYTLYYEESKVQSSLTSVMSQKDYTARKPLQQLQK